MRKNATLTTNNFDRSLDQDDKVAVSVLYDKWQK